MSLFENVKFDSEGRIVPSDEIKQSIERQQELRRRYEKRDLQNSYFKSVVLKSRFYKCQECGSAGNGSLEIHHERYNWICPYEELNEKSDCEECSEKHRDQFIECIDCVRILCRACHYKRHKYLAELTGDFLGFARVQKQIDDNHCQYCNHEINSEVICCPKCRKQVRLTEKQKAESKEFIDRVRKQIIQIFETEKAKTQELMTGDEEADNKMLRKKYDEMIAKFYEYLEKETDNSGAQGYVLIE